MASHTRCRRLGRSDVQFVSNGPDIPERLLQAHEEGEVVLFCGAGISCPAGLPLFGKLVKDVYAILSHTPDDLQAAAIKAKQFDRAIGLLESSIVGGRATVRESVETILKPDLSLPGATATHEALLTLGRNRAGRTRLVTTNFDCLFEEVIARKKLTIERCEAPLLPVPKNRWDALVYLHGQLPVTSGRGGLDRLVLSSGDFGLAYLTERWAARFLGELFRNFTVCFVGYSIDDPVLRYMMDALAADRLLGEAPMEMFAFGSYPKGKEDQRAREWEAKNVTPILYREHWNHRYLHRTLHAWADTYRGWHTRQGEHRRQARGLTPLGKHETGRLCRARAGGIERPEWSAGKALRRPRSGPLARMARASVREPIPAGGFGSLRCAAPSQTGRQLAIQPGPQACAVHPRAMDGVVCRRCRGKPVGRSHDAVGPLADATSG